MRLKVLVILFVITGVLLSGCMKNHEQTLTMKTQEPKVLTAPTPHVQKLIDQYQLEIVDYEYTKNAVGIGTRNGAIAQLIDARPEKKYMMGTIPSSINIPDTKIEQFIGQLEKVDKAKEMIVFCGGWKCEKSTIVAGYLKEKGFTNVKLYQAGKPEWAKKNYIEVGIPVAKSAMEKDSALLMDARPRVKYMKETIPGSLSMYDKELEKLAGRFPADKSTPVIAYCGGYHCNKSHIVARRMVELGYTKVAVFAAGLPGWKKALLPTTAQSNKQKKAVLTAKKAPVFIDGVKIGVDEGTVDGEWLNALYGKGETPSNIALVDVRNAQDFVTGHMMGAINIEAGNMNASELAAKLPKDKVSVFVCGSGARAMEAFLKLKDGKENVSKVLYFDANISCSDANKCTIEVNEPLG